MKQKKHRGVGVTYKAETLHPKQSLRPPPRIRHYYELWTKVLARACQLEFVLVLKITMALI